MAEQARTTRAELAPKSLVVLPGTLLRFGVVVAAVDWCCPVSGQVFGTWQEIRPGIAFNQAFGFPHYFKLSVVLNLANQHGFAQVVVFPHHGHATSQVLGLLTNHGCAYLGHLRSACFLYRLRIFSIV